MSAAAPAEYRPITRAALDALPLRDMLAVMETHAHPLDCVEWAATLAFIYPDEYGRRPLPDPGVFTTRAGRIEALADRHAAGLGLWNPADLLRYR
jgi:hypothetical protein